MTDLRIIDANAMAEEISSLSMIDTGLRAGKGFLQECMTEYRKSVLRIVDEFPAVDAVPVVRCKDCKHCKMLYPEKRIGEDATPRWHCNEMVGYFRPDDFCSYGERKGQEENDG